MRRQKSIDKDLSQVKGDARDRNQALRLVGHRQKGQHRHRYRQRLLAGQERDGLAFGPADWQQFYRSDIDQ